MNTISGIGKPGGARQLADDELGDEHLRPLPGAAKLQHIHARVVGFDDGRQRAALAQRRDVARGGDGTASSAPCASFVVPVKTMHQPMQERSEQQRRGDDEHEPGVQREESRESFRRGVTGAFTGPIPPNNIAAFRKASSQDRCSKQT